MSTAENKTYKIQNYKENEEKILVRNNKDKNNQSEMSNDINKKSLNQLTVQEKIKFTSFLTLALALLRIFSFDILLLIGEIVTSIIVYFYSLWNNKCMAIIVSINGLSGFIFSFIRIFIHFFTAKTESFGYTSTMGLIISIFATGVYGLILYFGYYGLKNFDVINFGEENNKKHNKHEVFHDNSSDYGAIGEENINKNIITDYGNKAKNIGNNLAQIGETVDNFGKKLNNL